MRKAMGETKEIYEQKVCIAAYEVVGFVGISVATLVAMGQTKAFMFLGWFAAEVVGLFCFVVFALLERLFATAFKLGRRTNSRSEPCRKPFQIREGLLLYRPTN